MTDTPDDVDAVENTLVDALHEDANALTEYPPGCPELIPFLSLRPRSRRARFKRKFSECTVLEDQLKDLQRRSKKLDNTKVSPDLARLRLQLSADFDDMVQVMDETLEIAAVDPEAYRAWSDEQTDDNAIPRLFQLYVNRSQVGEASSSTS